jgi:hypothetical protein
MQTSSTHLAADDLANDERLAGHAMAYPGRSRPDAPPAKPLPRQADGTPAEWWDCSVCGERSNPPLSERCFGCSAKRPGKADAPAESPPKAATDWKGIVKKVIGYGTFLGVVLGFVSFFFPVLKPIATVVKAIVAALSGLQL